MTFNDLNLIEPILRALSEEGYSTPTPIQQQAIPQVLEGHDLLGVAQTGTGKTAAFSVPILQILHQTAQAQRGGQGPKGRIRCLVLTPTRELAIQIGESFKAYGRHLPQLRSTVIFGGVGQHPQVQALQRGVEILVATPGRLLDLMNQGFVNLQHLEVFVLDEADRMLDMGFIHDVKKVIAKLPERRQSLFFSATMPPDVAKLADTILRNPAKVEVTPVSSTADTIQQALYFVDKEDKRKLLVHILDDQKIKSALVFARTKHGADRVVKDLLKAGIGAEAIHGNKSQNARQRALSNFKSRETRVLVATDIAARGIDVDELSHVINYELPNIPETYVHRIGRTGRAGNDGIALSFCDAEETSYLKDIHKLIGRNVPVITDHPYVLNVNMAVNTPPPPQRQGQGRNNGGNRNGSQPNQRRSDSSRNGSSRRDGEARQRPSGLSSSNQGQPAQTSNRPTGQSNSASFQRGGNRSDQNRSRSESTDQRPGRGTGNSRFTNFDSDKNY